MQKSIIICLLIFFFLPLPALRPKPEILSLPIPQHRFIHYNYNSILVPGKDSMRLNRFYQKIDTLTEAGKGSINILHIGGSHVQADMFSHRVRQNLDMLNGDFQTPRGLIFPYTVAQTNNPSNYKVTYSGKWNNARNIQKNRTMPLGMSGIAVYTKDPSAKINIMLNTDEDRRWEFTRLRLLGYVENGSNDVTPVLYHNNEAIEGYFDFDTETYLFDLSEPSDSFSIGFVQKNKIATNFVVRGFIPEKETPGIVYHAIGVNGASVSSYLGCEFFEKELHLLHPDLVIFGIGINDAVPRNFSKEAFYQDYNALIEKIHRVNPDCAYIFITNNDSFRRISRNNYQVNTNGSLAREVFFRLAENHQGGVWDLFSLMGGLSSMQQWQTAGLARVDKVHFTKDGYLLIGDMLYNALIDYHHTK